MIEVQPLQHPAVSEKRAAAIAARKERSAARRLALETMSDQEKVEFKARERELRQQKRAERQSSRKVRVAVSWLESMRAAISRLAVASAAGRPIQYGTESLQPKEALSRFSAAMDTEVAEVIGRKVTSRTVDTSKLWVVVRTAPDGSKLAFEKRYRGPKAESNANRAATRAQVQLLHMGIADYSFSAMKLADVESAGIDFSVQQQAA
ncbi:MAG: hypothetical protein JOZ81_20905 [Chloroflexi bacterium]|nr:hypothetical protein [Chloroflexota bacterium]